MLNTSVVPGRRERWSLFIAGVLLGLLCVSMMALARSAPGAGAFPIEALITGMKGPDVAAPELALAPSPSVAADRGEKATAPGGVILLDDNFDAENGGTSARACELDYEYQLINWEVCDSWDVCIDLTDDGSGGLAIDLIGDVPAIGFATLDICGITQPVAGKLTSITPFVLEPGQYTLQFDLAGSDPDGTDEVTVQLGDVYAEVFARTGETSFTTISRTITVSVPTSAHLIFEHSEPEHWWDYEGLLLDNVKLASGFEECECPFCSEADKQHSVGGPINTYSGRYVYETTDISIPTLGQPLRLERIYNSQRVTNTAVYSQPLGYGWTHNYDVRLIFPDDPIGQAGTIFVKAPRGSRLRFVQRPVVIGGELAFSYEPAPGIHASMTRTEIVTNTFVYTVTASNQETFVFDDSGYLATHIDPKGNETTLTYTGTNTLARVTAPGGQRWLDFGYDDAGHGGRLTSVTDHTGRRVGYGYDGDNNLIVVTDTLTQEWTYVYSGTTHLLHEVREPSPGEQVIERTFYDERGWAVRQEDGLGHLVVEIAYPSSYSRVITEAGKVVTDTYNAQNLWTGQMAAGGNSQTYTFDANWNRDGFVDANGNSTYYEYGGDCGCHPTVITDALGSQTTMTYDGNNNLRSPHRCPGPDGAVRVRGDPSGRRNRRDDGHHPVHV